VEARGECIGEWRLEVSGNARHKETHDGREDLTGKMREVLDLSGEDIIFIYFWLGAIMTSDSFH
jgi:hypothetical protein